MKLAYKFFYIINTLFIIYIFANSFILYDTSPDNIFIFIVLSLLFIALTFYYFIKDIKPTKGDYIISSIFVLFLMFSMIMIINIQSKFEYANTICYFDLIVLIPCLVYSIYGLIKNKE